MGLWHRGKKKPVGESHVQMTYYVKRASGAVEAVTPRVVGPGRVAFDPPLDLAPGDTLVVEAQLEVAE